VDSSPTPSPPSGVDSPASRSGGSTLRMKSPTYTLSDGVITSGPASFLPFTKVPLVDFRSRTMILPSLTTILVCFLEMFPLGRQMSFSSTRPMVISSDSKSSLWVAPPFSVRMTLKGIVGSPLVVSAYFKSIEDGE
jgi:hypothetical protein